MSLWHLRLGPALQMCFTNPRQRGRTTSIDLLMTYVLMHRRRLLAFYHNGFILLVYGQLCVHEDLHTILCQVAFFLLSP